MTASGDRNKLDPQGMLTFGASVDFGHAASDYATHRAGFPNTFFDMLAVRGYASPGQSALDLGTGTGTIARGLARMGIGVTGLDPSQTLLDQAAGLDRASGLEISYHCAKAEQPPFDDQSFDLITAGQCWHWFNRGIVAENCARLLRPGGRLIIAHFDWLPMPGNVVTATEELILAHNSAWVGSGGSGIYPDWLGDMANAGFHKLETASFDVDENYSHDAWRGRVRASAGIAASLDPAAITNFDAELSNLLARNFPQDPLDIPHRVWLATGVIT